MRTLPLPLILGPRAHHERTLTDMHMTMSSTPLALSLVVVRDVARHVRWNMLAWNAPGGPNSYNLLAARQIVDLEFVS